MKVYIIIFLFLASIKTYGQYGTVQIVDSTDASHGVSRIITDDLNEDGFLEIIVSQSASVDQVSFYLNDGTGHFSPKQVLESEISTPVSVATGDFDNNGTRDIASVSWSSLSGKVFWIPNNGDGTFSESVIIDSTFQAADDIKVADFDSNGTDDIVVIGTHVIYLYRNTGNGNFTKEAIPTIESESEIFLWELRIGDLDNDGDLDIISAESPKTVAYINDGNANFSPIQITDQWGLKVHLFDANGDEFPDLAVYEGSGYAHLYINEGDNTMHSDSSFFHATTLSSSITSVDIDGDGVLDIYTAPDYDGKAFINNGDGVIQSEIVINNEHTINQVAAADLNNDGVEELIWSAIYAGPIAYQNFVELGVEPTSPGAEVIVYPNPTSGMVTITLEEGITAVTVFNMSGQKVYSSKVAESQSINLSRLQKGIYSVHIQNEKNTIVKYLIIE